MDNVRDFFRDLRQVQTYQALLAEFMGTAFLVLVGCGSTTGGPNYTTETIEIAFCFGLTVGIMVQVTGHISGGHINPAVTLGMLVTRNISIVRGILYVIAQLLGAICGAAILFGLLPGSVRNVLGQTDIHPKLSVGQGIGIEILITFVLVFTVLSVVDPRRPEQKGIAPMVIGLSVATCHLWAIRYTGASMNTARSFGPAVMMNMWTNHWVYWVGPLVGGAIAGVLHKFLFSPPPDEEETDDVKA